MTRDDTDRLFELLRIFRPSDPKVDDKRLRSAWALVLQPYEVDDVRAAVADYFREEKYFPDVTDIARRCTPTPQNEPPPEPSARSVEVLQRHRAELTAWHDEFVAELHRAGLPTLHEAVEQGLTIPAWNRLLDASGFWDGAGP